MGRNTCPGPGWYLATTVGFEKSTLHPLEEIMRMRIRSASGKVARGGPVECTLRSPMGLSLVRTKLEERFFQSRG
jgi:hypothetical protein